MLVSAGNAPLIPAYLLSLFIQVQTAIVKEIHKSFPTVSTRPIPPYEDEDFTLEARIPAGMDREEAMNECIRHPLRVDDQFGFAILTRVKETENKDW